MSNHYGEIIGPQRANEMIPAPIKKVLHTLLMFLNLLGFDPFKFINTVRGLPAFITGYLEFTRQLREVQSPFAMGRFYPCFGDDRSEAGVTRGHYFNQDLLVAHRIFHNNPVRHVDIGSRIDGFVAHVASFREIEVIDIRPISQTVNNIIFKKIDFMSEDINISNYTDSFSSLHAIEHFGLGRYGDKIDCNGHIKALNNIYKMLKSGGKFYLSVPIGRQRIEFNGHRVFDVKYVLELINNNYSIDSFSYVNDRGFLQINVPLTASDIDRNYSCNYGVGIFELTKLVL